MKQTGSISDNFDVEAQLAKLGVTLKIALHAVEVAQGAVAGTTRHHPPGRAGSESYFEGSRALRDRLRVEDWESVDLRGQALVVSPDNKIALTVSGGDHNTGRLLGKPKTRSPKGRVTQCAVLANSRFLFAEDEAAARAEVARINAQIDRDFWVLLIYHDEIARETRSELSRPVIVVGEMKGKRQLSEWSARIILPAIPFGDDIGSAQQTPSDSNLSGEVNVEIKRRA